MDFYKYIMEIVNYLSRIFTKGKEYIYFMCKALIQQVMDNNKYVNM